MDERKLEKMYRFYLMRVLPAKLKELEEAAKRRARDKWRNKDGQEVRRLTLQFKKDLHELRKMAIKADKNKIKEL